MFFDQKRAPDSKWFDNQSLSKINKDKLEFEIRFSRDTRICSNVFSAIEEVVYIASGLKPYISNEMLDELRQIHSNVRPIPLIFSVLQLHTGATSDCWRSMHSPENWWILGLAESVTYIYSQWPSEAPSAGSPLPKELDFHSYLHLLDTLEIVLLLEVVFLFDIYIYRRWSL